MRRRDFISLVGGVAATWPLAVRARQGTIPIIGFLNPASARTWASYVAAFREGLKKAGFIEGRNVKIEYRWAEGHNDRLPTLAADLLRQKVAVIAATGGTVSARAAKAATTVTPIVFVSADDPVAAGLVAHFAHPGGNVTGVTFLGGMLIKKNLELLHEMVPSASNFALLVNPKNPNTNDLIREAHDAITTIGKKIHIFNASTKRDIDKAFRAFVKQGIDALIVGTDPFFNVRRDQLVALAGLHKIPAIYYLREYVTAGGLMSYGTDLDGAYRLTGTYVARILKGEKPAQLPVQQSTRVELVINLKAAKALGIAVPPMLFARADAVIE